MSDEGYWIPALAMWVALARRLPALVRNPHDPVLRAVCAVLFLNGSTSFCANPRAIGLVNGVTHWKGRDWDDLSTQVAPPVATLGTLTATAGFLMPLLGERLTALRSNLDDWLTHRALRPLWETLRTAVPSIVAPMPVPWWDIDLRLTRRIAEIHDGRLALRPYCDTTVTDDALLHTQAEGLDGQAADAVAEAATLAAAITAKAQGVEPVHTTGDAPEAPPHRRATLVQISRALSSPTVAAFSRPAHQQETRP